MQNIAHARRPALLTRQAVVATLIALPVLPRAASSESIASETRNAIAYLGVAVRLLLWPLNQKAVACPMRIDDGTVRTDVVRDRRSVPTSLGVELSESSLRGLSATPVSSPPVPSWHGREGVPHHAG